MTPQEKAKELVDKFKQYSFFETDIDIKQDDLFKQQLQSAKQCALIAVDEILRAKPGGGYMTDVEYISTDSTKYWNEVREEIQSA